MSVCFKGKGEGKGGGLKRKFGSHSMAFEFITRNQKIN